ncbi:MAG: hypothetical protein ABI868_14485 [Acidobacteriota bacterium]
MKGTCSPYIALAALAILTGACGFQHESTVTAPTQNPADTAGSGGAAPTGGTSLIGTWASQNLTVPSASSCGNFQWAVTSQTDSNLSGAFFLECAGNITINGTAQGQISGTSVPMTATGTANIPGVPGCGFSLSGTGTIVDNREITIPYSGTTCFGPVSGTETLRRRTAETPVIERPQPLSPSGNQRIATLRPTFTFANADRSGPVGALSYDVQVSDIYSFDTVYAALSVDEQPGTTSVQFGHDGPYDKYFFWRVRGHDGATFGPWSGPAAFDMPDAPYTPPPAADPLFGCGSLAGGDKVRLIACIQSRLNPPHTVEGAFDITRRVAWALRGEGAGLLIKPGGENIVTWQGRSFAAGRICYPDGHIFKVLSDVPTTNGPSWQDNEFVDRSLYAPAIDPNR